MRMNIQQQIEILSRLGLEGYGISQNRQNFRFHNRLIAKEFYATGNGYVWAKELLGKGYKIDPRGWVSVKEFTAEELEELIENAKTQTKFKVETR